MSRLPHPRLSIVCTLIATSMSVASVAACNFPFSARAEAGVGLSSTLSPTPVVISPANAPTPVTGPTRIPSPTIVPSPTQAASPSATATPFVDPVGCARPPDDYTRMIVNGSKLNYRTFWMLRHAKTLFKGTIDFTGWAVTQGSYNPGGVTASFGTHDGGGAVDIGVIWHNAVLRNELPNAIQALRIAGFAAWVREASALYAGSPIHIHAIAVGDAELSPAAREQLTGTFGYFRGYNGLPQKDNNPIADRHGGPLLCQWMIDMGYRDMRIPSGQQPGTG
jgi:hypothetical protein